MEEIFEALACQFQNVETLLGNETKQPTEMISEVFQHKSPSEEQIECDLIDKSNLFSENIRVEVLHPKGSKRKKVR